MTTIREFSQTSSPNNVNMNSGMIAVDSFEPYTIDTPISFTNESFPKFSIFTKSVYGITGESLGFGDGSFGSDSYMKLDKFKLEYDFENKVVYLIVPVDYTDEYKLETINGERFKLTGLNTENEFLILQD